MKMLIALILAVLTCAALLMVSANAEKDWTQVMTWPTEEQLSQPGEYRSPYITFAPDFDPSGITGCAMDFRIDFDPLGTYICPGCWNLGRDKDACWIITSGVPGLCKGPEKLSGYEIPVTDSGAAN